MGVAEVHASDVANRFSDYGNQERLRLADEALARALTLDPNNVRAAVTRCLLRRMQRRFEEAIRACETAIAANPADPVPYPNAGFARIALGQPEQSFAWFEQADRLAPRDPTRWLWFLGTGVAHFLLGHDEQAIEWLRKSAEANPDYKFTYSYLAAAHALLGQEAQAQQALREYLRLDPGITIKKVRARSRPSVPAYLALRERFYDGLRKAGLPEE